MSATNRGARRNANDYYPTPFNHVEAFMKALALEHSSSQIAPPQSFLEPCYGDRRILRSAARHFSECRKFYGFEISEGSDFLSAQLPAHGDRVDLCVTNPPFSLAEEFIGQALQCADTVCMLLRLNFLGGQGRFENFWAGMPRPDTIYVLPDRPRFIPGATSTDATEYGWFCWWGARMYNKWCANGVSAPAALTWLRAPPVTVDQFYEHLPPVTLSPWSELSP